MSGFFRDHYISDLVGFVYSRMGAEAAADDLHRRLRAIGDREPDGRTATVSVILDGENAWEYYPGNGREFLRQFYRRIQQRSRKSSALTISEAIEAAPNSRVSKEFSRRRGSTRISMSGSATPRTFARGNCCATRASRTKTPRSRRTPASERGPPGIDEDGHGKRAYDAVLAAEGSDWCWWYGPEHGSANDAEFDALYRKHLTEIYNAARRARARRARPSDQARTASAGDASRPPPTST